MRPQAAMIEFAQDQLFKDSDKWEMTRNPYQRSLRPQALGSVDLNTPLQAVNFMDYESLAAQRILTTVYEQDLVFLPHDTYEGWRADFDSFYSKRLRDLAGNFRVDLEEYVYGYLEKEIEVSENWTLADLHELIESMRTDEVEEKPLWERVIRGSRDPVRAAKMWLIQFAPDFLSESSPMMKNVLGNYGPVQSEWFKILIDEYGYGVHSKKHSTLYEKTLSSVGLSHVPHNYWQYYLASALSANNFFHYLGSEHRNFFRYAGALAVTESTLVDFCGRAATMLRDVLGDGCDVEYFTEHCHIDDHHGRMAIDDVCAGLVESYGDDIVPQMAWGILAYDLVMKQFEEQFSAQIEWMDSQPDMFELHKEVVDRVRADESLPVVDLDEHFNELSNSHCHNQDELCHILTGEMYFFSGFDSKLILGPGDGVVIRGRRQHGADILSSSCEYQIYTIGDVDRWR